MGGKPTLSQLNAGLVGLKGAELRTLCLACGLPSSGTKEVLTARLEADFLGNHGRPRELPAQRRVLSVDLGLKNFAYAVVVPGGPLLSTAPGTPAKKMSQFDSAPFRQPPRVVLEGWRHLNLSSDLAVQVAEKYQWSPAAMAKLAYKLVQEHFVPLRPTHILLENQRWRTNSSTSVLEWTMRVNNLESMIHATLRTMQELGHYSGNLVSLPPNRVSNFWVGTAGEHIEDVERKPLETDAEFNARVQRAKSASKTAKASPRKKARMIDIVGNWLQDENVIRPAQTTAAENVERVMKLYADRWRGVRRQRGAEQLEEAETGAAKLDDLAECLLQGMAFLKWEQNKQVLQEHGVEAILKQEEEQAQFEKYKWYDPQFQKDPK